MGESKCRRTLPVALKITSGPGDVVYGYIESNEIEGSSHPMLLSLHLQQKIGLVKNMQTGEIRFADKGAKIETAI